MQDRFREFLEAQGYTDGAVKSRMSRANKAEGLIGEELDTVSGDDEKMYKALIRLRDHDNNGNLQNAVRLYYEYRNGRKFPRLRDYEESR